MTPPTTEARLGRPLGSTAQIMAAITNDPSSRLAMVAPLAAVGRRRRLHRTGRPVLVAVAHGSRDPAAAREAEALLDLVRALRPGLPIRLGHIELSEPLIDDTLASLSRGMVVLVPLLLSRGYHIKTDIPDALARAPHLTGRIAAPLGPHPLLAEALHHRLTEAGWRRRHRSAVVLAAAGSRHPESAVDTGRTAAMLRARLGVPVMPAYAAAAHPTVPEAVAELTARGHRDIAVASYFTAPGRFPTQCAKASPTIAARPIGAHPALARLVLERYDEALTAVSTVAAAPLAAAR